MTMTMTMRRAAILLLVTSTASAGDPRAAEALYQRAQALMKKADATKEEIHRACEYFVESYKQDPALNTLVASAACHEKEGKNATAWGEYKEVGMQEGAAGEYARQRAADLEKAGFLKITVKVHETTKLSFKIDDAQLSVAPDDFPMDPGSHDLEVSAPGKKTFKLHFELTQRVSPLTIDVPELATEDKVAPPPPLPVTQPGQQVIQVIEPTKREPVYRGFYGYVSTPFWVGTGAGYQAPAGLMFKRHSDPYIGLNVKLVLGWSLGWLGFEGMSTFSVIGRFGDWFADSSGVDQIKTGYPSIGGFFGAGARATSQHRIIRFTGALALGVSPHILANPPTNLVKYAPCTGNNNGMTNCMHDGDGSTNPGYTAFAMAGDIGIFLGGGAPSGKLWLGIDWMLEFPPDVTVGPIDSVIPPQYSNNRMVTILHGPQFFIGPVIGVGFGH